VEAMILGEVQDLPKGLERENKIIQTIIRQLLFALDGLHSTGIVHRDIKPQNVIFSEGSRTFKIIDLGAAADLRVGINYIPKEFLLDPRYAAPEQYIMSTQTPSAPSAPVAAALSPVLWQMNVPDRFDIYSTGLIFLQMVTGAFTTVTHASRGITALWIERNAPVAKWLGLLRHQTCLNGCHVLWIEHSAPVAKWPRLLRQYASRPLLFAMSSGKSVKLWPHIVKQNCSIYLSTENVRKPVWESSLELESLAFPALRSDSSLIQFNRQLKRSEYDLVAWRKTVEPRASTDLRRGFELLDLDGGIGWELLTSMVRYKAGQRTSAKAALAYPYFDREGLLVLSFMQKLRLQYFRATQKDYGEAATWIIQLMAKSGTKKEGGFTEAQLQNLREIEPKKKANPQRNALASVLRLQRKIIKTVNQSMDELNQRRKSYWWSRWIPREE
ncbi:hypothetical protein RJ639_024400, partial [Escallonia herrerae]